MRSLNTHEVRSQRHSDLPRDCLCGERETTGYGCEVSLVDLREGEVVGLVEEVEDVGMCDVACWWLRRDYDIVSSSCGVVKGIDRFR